MIETLKKRQLELKDEHDKVFDRMNDLQDELNRLASTRLQLEGAFKEVSKLIEDAEKAESNDTKSMDTKTSK